MMWHSASIPTEANSDDAAPHLPQKLPHAAAAKYPPLPKKGGARADIRPYGVLLAGIVGQAGNTFFKEMND